MMNGNSTGHILRILDAWITEEVLSPQPIPTKEELQTLYRTMVRFNEYEEPWKEPRYRRARLEKSVFWMAYLGQMDLKNATEKMLTKFPDDYAGERVSVKGNTTLAVVVLDEQGRLASGSVFLSSFAWGYVKFSATN